MNDESRFFTTWLNRQPPATMLPNQWRSVAKILDRLSTGDLISVMYNAEDQTALQALRILRSRYVEELLELEAEANYQREAA